MYQNPIVYLYKKSVQCLGHLADIKEFEPLRPKPQNPGQTKENQGKLRKTELRTPSGLPRGTQESSKATPRAPRSTPGGVRGCSGSSQERSRRVPGEPESAPRAPRELPRALRDRSESPKERSKSPDCCKSALEQRLRPETSTLPCISSALPANLQHFFVERCVC